MKPMRRALSVPLLALLLFSMSTGASASDYTFTTQAPSDYYSSSSYEDVYGSQYNFGGPNVVDYQIPELEFGTLSTTQTGIMEKIRLPGLQDAVVTVPGGGYGLGTGPVEIADIPGLEDNFPARLYECRRYEALRRQHRHPENPIPGDQYEGVGGRKQYQYAEGPWALFLHLCLGWKCRVLWTQQRGALCDRRHQRPGNRRYDHLHHCLRHPHLCRFDGADNLQYRLELSPGNSR